MNLYSTGFTNDPSQGGIAMHEADSSASHDHCLSQLPFESGLAEHRTDLTNEWQVNISSLKQIHGTEAFEGAAKSTAMMGSESWGEGQIQQDDSSSSERIATLRSRPGHALGKRKGSASKDSIVTKKVLESGEKKAKCLSTKVAGASANASKAQVDEVRVTLKEQQSPESEPSGELSPRSTLKASSKSQVMHPKQDYIHVRARRGQATDSHSLAERVRREKISERMKFLQDLVPGCSKVTGKAVMLDEIINYVQSLQRQIEFLSMKLAAVDPRLDINLLHLLNKEPPQARSPETILTSPDIIAGYWDYQTQLQIQQINNYNVDWRSVGTLCDAYLKRSVNIAPLPHAPATYNECFIDSLTQTLNGVCDAGDLQSIVHTSSIPRRQEFFGQDTNNFAPGFPGLRYSTTGQLKVEH